MNNRLKFLSCLVLSCVSSEGVVPSLCSSRGSQERNVCLRMITVSLVYTLPLTNEIVFLRQVTWFIHSLIILWFTLHLLCYIYLQDVPLENNKRNNSRWLMTRLTHCSIFLSRSCRGAIKLPPPALFNSLSFSLSLSLSLSFLSVRRMKEEWMGLKSKWESLSKIDANARCCWSRKTLWTDFLSSSFLSSVSVDAMFSFQVRH